MDNTVIEHLACNEVNRMILQEPFKLVSEIKVNDKSPSYDGEILVYSSSKLNKGNLQGAVKVQVKGTTVNKKIKKRKISHTVCKEDLEVYKRFGEGILYFVVPINTKTGITTSQVFYNALSPLDIERYLNEINRKGNESIQINFKILADNQLDRICRLHLKNVEKQPICLIDGSKKREYQEYKIEYNIDDFEEFDFFENIGYVYGIKEDLEIPIEAIIPENVNIKSENSFELDGHRVHIKYQIQDSPKEITIWFEDTFKLAFDKRKKAGIFNIKNFKSINSSIAILMVLKYIILNKKLPIDVYDIEVDIDVEEEFLNNIDEEIKFYQELLSVCNKIGILGDFCFHENENVKEFIYKITEIFIKGNYDLIKKEKADIGSQFIKLNLTEYIKLLLFKEEKTNSYKNLFDKEFINQMQTTYPKNKGDFDPNNVEHYTISYYSIYPVDEIFSFTNFDFEVYKNSFNRDKHEKSLEQNNNLVLGLIDLFDKTNKRELLELSIYLLQGLIETDKNSEVYKLNLLQTQKRMDIDITEKDEEYLYSLIESTDDKKIKFVAYVILGLKIPSKRVYESLEDELNHEIESWPIYYLYQKLIVD